MATTPRVFESGIVSRPAGTAVPAGAIGEVIAFTERAVTCTNAATWYGSGASSMGTITPGVWLILGYFKVKSNTSASLVAYGTASNGDNDSTGLLTDSQQGVANVSGSTANSIISMVPKTILVTTSTPIYAKGYSEDEAGLAITVGGFALRIG